MLIIPIIPKPITIKGFKHYTISFWGGILRNTRTGKISKGWLNEQGYRRTKLQNGKKISNQYFQRLVALTWIENKHNKTDVHHKNKIRNDNNVPNLEWLSHRENIAYIKSEPLVKELKEAPF